MLFYEVQLCPATLQLLLECVMLFWKICAKWGNERLCQCISSALSFLGHHGVLDGARSADRFCCPSDLLVVLGTRTVSASWVFRIRFEIVEKKHSMENGCFRGLHQYSKICCKRSKVANFSYLLNFLTGFHTNLKISPLMSATDISELTRSVSSKKHLLNNKVLIFMGIAYLFRDLKSRYRLNELLHTPQAEVQRS